MVSSHPGCPVRKLLVSLPLDLVKAPQRNIVALRRLEQVQGCRQNTLRGVKRFLTLLGPRVVFTLIISIDSSSAVQELESNTTFYLFV